jgi:hypothetical protein
MNELIDQTRLENQARQIAQIQQRQRRERAIVPTYTGRDRATGLRQLHAADGGVIYARYGSNTRPETLIGFPGRLGLPGFVTQKPT